MKYKVLSSSEYSLGHFKISTIDDVYIELIRDWRNRQIAILRQTSLISKIQQIEYFEHKVFPLLRESFPVQLLFNCFYKEEFIGYGGIVHISYENRVGEISFLLDPAIPVSDFYEKIFISFLKLMDQIAFQELKLNKLFTETFSTRLEHVPILDKAGYLLEGIRRSHLIINEQPADIYLQGRLLSDVEPL